MQRSDAPIAPHEERVIYGAAPNQVIQLHARCEQLWTEASHARPVGTALIAAEAGQGLRSMWSPGVVGEEGSSMPVGRADMRPLEWTGVRSTRVIIARLGEEGRCCPQASARRGDGHERPHDRHQG